MKIKELKMLEEQAELLSERVKECRDTSELIALSHALNETVQAIILLYHESRFVHGVQPSRGRASGQTSEES